MIDDVILRRAKDEDAAGISRIYNYHVDSGDSTFDNVHWTAELTLQLMRQHRADGWFVAIRDSDTLGWAAARQYSNRFGYRFTCETSIYLEPSAMGKGIADALQHRVESHCYENGIRHAVARVAAHNVHSIAFHKRNGYELVGVQREVGRMNHRWVDVVIMQKIFGERAAP